MKIAKGYGGPRREFFNLILQEIEERYFDHGDELPSSNSYYDIGVLFGKCCLILFFSLFKFLAFAPSGCLTIYNLFSKNKQVTIQDESFKNPCSQKKR